MIIQLEGKHSGSIAFPHQDDFTAAMLATIKELEANGPGTDSDAYEKRRFNARVAVKFVAKYGKWDVQQGQKREGDEWSSYKKLSADGFLDWINDPEKEHVRFTNLIARNWAVYVALVMNPKL